MKSLLGLALVSLAATLLPAGAVDYEKDIMPIFMEKCADCHSAEAEKVKGGLRLDDPKHFQSRFEKNSLVVPGDWDASYLFITIFRTEDAEEAMPPKGKGDRLNVDEVKLVQQWINEGAPINGTRGERGPEIVNDDAMFAHLPPGTGAKPDGAGSALEKAMPAVEQDWTNKEGQTITATLLRVEGDVALLRMKNGQVYRYPIEKLSDESQAKLKANPGKVEP